MREAIAASRREGCFVVVRDASCHDTGRTIAREAGRSGQFDAIIAAGGDGTIRSVAAALRGTDTPVGLLPLGTGNVMAHEIGIAQNAEAITDVWRNGASVPVTGGLANEAPFFLMAGAGLDAYSVAKLDMALKRHIGKLAYVSPVIRAIFRPAPEIRVVLDGQLHTARWIVVCNARSYAGSFTLSAQSHLFEPGLIAMLCRARTRRALIANILMIGTGYSDRAPHIEFVPFLQGKLSAGETVFTQVDGESYGELPLTISEDRMPVHVLAPQRVAQRFKASKHTAAA